MMKMCDGSTRFGQYIRLKKVSQKGLLECMVLLNVSYLVKANGVRYEL